MFISKFVDYLAKSRLRALNLQNQTTHPFHTDFNLKNLQKSWKLWYQIFFSTTTLINQVTSFSRKSFKKTLIKPYKNTRKLKKYLFLSKFSLKKSKSVTINKSYWTSVKVLILNSKLFLIFTYCPLSQFSNVFKKKKKTIRRKKIIRKVYL